MRDGGKGNEGIEGGGTKELWGGGGNSKKEAAFQPTGDDLFIKGTRLSAFGTEEMH